MEKGPIPPPPPPGFMPPPPPPGQQPPVIVMTAQFGPESKHMRCPHCQTEITTDVKNESNMKTHAIALALCVFGFWCCAPCPYCIDSCLVPKHYCPVCKLYVGEGKN